MKKTNFFVIEFLPWGRGELWSTCRSDYKNVWHDISYIIFHSRWCLHVDGNRFPIQLYYYVYSTLLHILLSTGFYTGSHYLLDFILDNYWWIFVEHRFYVKFTNLRFPHLAQSSLVFSPNLAYDTGKITMPVHFFVH